MSRADNTVRFTVNDRSPTVAVIESVASFRNEEPHNLPPLAEYTEPDIIDRFVAKTPHGTIRFTYAEVEVEVSSSGTIRITELAV